MSTEIIKELKWPVAVTLIVLILGSFAYFTIDKILPREIGMNNSAMIVDENADFYRAVELKVAISPEKTVKLFATTGDTALQSKLKASEGRSAIEDGKILIGSLEAEMMRNERLFSNPGDQLENLFGLNTTVGGVLEKTGGLMDDFHIVSSADFEKVVGERKAFVRFNAEVPKLFYTQGTGDNFSFSIALESSSIENYKTVDVAGRTYYHLILGSKEAEMMQEEKLFQRTGDSISNFFGKDVVIVGIAKETNTSLDMMHITPWSSRDIPLD